MPEDTEYQPLHLLAIDEALKLAGISPTATPEERLKQAGVQRYPVPIHEQLKPWLVEKFPPQDNKNYPVNVTKLIRNLLSNVPKASRAAWPKTAPTIKDVNPPRDKRAGRAPPWRAPCGLRLSHVPAQILRSTHGKYRGEQTAIPRQTAGNSTQGRR